MALEALEALEGWESESEAAEAARRPVKKPPSTPSYKPRPSPAAAQYVTQAQLETSLGRVDSKVKIVSDGVGTINAKLASLHTALKKEAEERKKATESQNKDLNQKVQMLSLVPLLLNQSTSSLTLQSGSTLTASDGSTVNTISVPDTNTLDSMLPLLLISGLGGSGGGFGLGGDSSGGMGDGSSLMLLAVALAASKK
jgi:hypothetical protein